MKKSSTHYIIIFTRMIEFVHKLCINTHSKDTVTQKTIDEL